MSFLSNPLEKLLSDVRIIKESQIETSHWVGRGTFGKIYKGTLQIDGRIEHAAIKLSTHETDQSSLINEANYLSRLKHKNVVKFFGVCSEPFSLVIEYINGTTLYDVIHKPHIFSYDISLVISWALQCAEGIAYLHSMEPSPVIHKDLKTLNLLVDWEGKKLTIVDFGCATGIKNTMTNRTGTVKYMAPEVFALNKYTEKCDVYSFAIILWEVFYKQIPFEGREDPNVMWEVYNGRRPELDGTCGKIEIENLIKICWAPNPDERPSMDEVVEIMKPISESHPVEGTLIQLYDYRYEASSSNNTFARTRSEPKSERCYSLQLVQDMEMELQGVPFNVDPVERRNLENNQPEERHLRFEGSRVFQQPLFGEGSISTIPLEEVQAVPVMTTPVRPRTPVNNIPDFLRPVNNVQSNFNINLVEDNRRLSLEYSQLTQTSREHRQHINQLDDEIDQLIDEINRMPTD